MEMCRHRVSPRTTLTRSEAISPPTKTRPEARKDGSGKRAILEGLGQ
jgi:hypothetical protein